MPTDTINARNIQHGSDISARFDSFLTPGQLRLVEGYNRLAAEAERRGYAKASLINLHPFSWPVTGPAHQTDIKIPGVALQEEYWLTAPKVRLSGGMLVPYTQHIFSHWKPLQQKYLVGQLDFEEINDSGHIWPIDQARDGVHQNSLSADRGGVFCYEGTHNPLTNAATKEAERSELDKVQATQMAYYREQYEKYADAYGSRQSTNAWKDLAGKGKYHRWIAMYLFRIGSLKALPPWYEEISQPGGLKQAKCGGCQQSVENGAVTCSCGRVLIPFTYFEDMHGDAETPGARLVAKRCTKEEIDLLLKHKRLDKQQLMDWGLMAKPEKAS